MTHVTLTGLAKSTRPEPRWLLKDEPLRVIREAPAGPAGECDSDSTMDEIVQSSRVGFRDVEDERKFCRVRRTVPADGSLLVLKLVAGQRYNYGVCDAIVKPVISFGWNTGSFTAPGFVLRKRQCLIRIIVGTQSERTACIGMAPTRSISHEVTG